MKKTKRILASLCISVAIEWQCGIVSAVEPAPETPMPQHGLHDLTGEHTREEESAIIRKHHLKRLDNRLTIDPTILHQTCRYESEISTPPPKKRVALTFDDGPEPDQTELILATLKKYDIPAAFFMIGKKAQRYPRT